MYYFLRSTLCSLILALTALAVQAADQPVPSPATTQLPLLKTAPGLSLLPAAKELPQSAPSTRIGVVDLNKVSSASAMGKAAQSQIKGQQIKLQKQVELKKKQIEKFKADTERQLPSLTPQQREVKSKEFQKKVMEFQKFGVNAEKELQSAQEKLMKELLEAIGKAATELGKSRGVTAIVSNRELLYLGAGTEPIDITDELVKYLDLETGKNKKK